MSRTLLALCPPGLESVTARELADLGLRPPRYLKAGQRAGPLFFEGGLEALYRANLWLRTGERVLLRLGRFPAASFAELERGALALPWREYLAPGRPLTVRADCERSKLYHEKAVAQRVGQASGAPPALDGAQAQLAYVRVEDDVCTVDLDSSGEPLHRRGYRLETAKAPLRETVAAAMVLASGWDGRAPLLDPFCGSGTILIEAALLARRAAPGQGRRFAFMDWPSFDARLWARLVEGARGASSGPPLIGSDRDAGAIEAARANAQRAGVADALELSRRAVSAVEPPAGPGWIVTNPPYGHRVGGGDVRDVYAQLGKVVAARCSGWRVAMLCPSLQLARATGLLFSAGLTTKNGGLNVVLATL